MQRTLEQVLQDVGGYVDQAAETPTSTDLTTRINYANRALIEQIHTYDFDELRKTHEFSGIIASQTSLALGSNFVKPMSAVYLFNGTTPTEFTIIPRDERFGHSNSDYIAYIDGNSSDGYALIIPQGLPSGASLVMDKKIAPAAFATLTDKVPFKSSEYITQRTISLVLEARGDDRFPIARAEADKAMAAAIEVQNSKNLGMVNKVPTPTGFRIGFD